MIAKYIDEKFNIIRGELTQFLSDKGYKEYDFDLETKEDGSYYTYYNQDGTADTAKIMLEDKANTLQAIESAAQE